MYWRLPEESSCWLWSFCIHFSVHTTVVVLSEYMDTLLCLRGTSTLSSTIHTNNKASISKSKIDIVTFSPFYILVTIWPLRSIIFSIQWFPVPMYLPSTLFCSPPPICLWMSCMMGPLASVLLTWTVLWLLLVIVSVFRPPIFSLL